MSLRAKMENAAEPVVFYEVIPPGLGTPGDLEDRLRLVGEVASHVDAINIPEIREELRQGTRRSHLQERLEPREFSRAIHEASGLETVVNRVTVHESLEEQCKWLRESCDRYHLQNLILVGGDSREIRYPGPPVVEVAARSIRECFPLLLGGIAIPSRAHEVRRVLEKAQRGISFFTTQVLLDSQNIVALVQALDGVDVRLMLSFTPVSHVRDLKFLEWLGVETPPEVLQEFSDSRSPEEAVECSFRLAKRILSEVFNHLPANPPALGLQVERITKRNSSAARRMLTELGEFYRQLLPTRFPSGRARAAKSEAIAPKSSHVPGTR